MKKNSIRRWIILGFSVSLLLSIAMSAVANYYNAYKEQMRANSDKASILSDIIIQQVDRQWDLDEPGLSIDSDSYIRSRRTLRNLCSLFQMDYVSVYQIDPVTNTRHYYFFVASDSEEDDRILGEYNLKTVPVNHLQTGEQAILEGSREIQFCRLQGGEYTGEVIWYVPVFDDKGELFALIGMDYSMSMIRDKALQNFLGDIIPVSLSLFAGMLILLFLVQRRIIGPVSELSKRIRGFALDSREKKEPMHIVYKDEIWEIADSFEKMTVDISEYVNNIRRLTKEKTEIRTEMGLARRIQYGLVPKKTELSGGAFCASAMTLPAKAVGGDFYDCFLRDDSSVCIVIGDVSGKGISAGITMAMIKTIIHEKLMAGLSPAQTLNRANDQFCLQNPEDQFITAFIAVLNPATGELCYANAGHTYPVLLRDEPSFLIPEPGIVIGLFEGSDIKDYTITLSPDQGILLYTDGVDEAVNPQSVFFGKERLLDALRGFSSHNDTSKEAVLRLSSAVGEFCDGCEPSDDMTILALIYRGESAWKSLSVEMSAFRQIRAAVFDAVGDTPESRQALLACDETVANIVNYSGASDMAFSCERLNGQLRVSFSDNGVYFDPTAVSPEEKEFEALDSGGMGISLIRQTVSSMHYERRDDRNVLTLVFSL